MKVVVFGAGGVGAYFGGRLALAGADVHLVARGSHLAALRDGGLRVRSRNGDFELSLPATDDPREIGPCDYVLFCVKSFDTEAAAARLRPLLSEHTAVLSLQNGIDNEDKLAAAIGARHVMGGAAFLLAAIDGPGSILHYGGPGTVVFGELDGRRTERAERLLEACRRAQVAHDVSSDILPVLWDKFAFICALAGMTAATRLPVGDIRALPESWEMFRRIVGEVATLAVAEGVSLPASPVERHAAFAERLEPESFSSLHHDLTHGHRMELEALHGTVVRLAAGHGLDLPMCRAVYALLKPWAARNEPPADDRAERASAVRIAPD